MSSASTSAYARTNMRSSTSRRVELDNRRGSVESTDSQPASSSLFATGPTDLPSELAAAVERSQMRTDSGVHASVSKALRGEARV